MKTFKLIACIAVVVAALVYAGAPPIVVGGLSFVAPKSTGSITTTNGWIVIKGYDEKTTIQLDKTSAKPAGQCIVIQTAKALKGSRKDTVDGNLAQVVYGLFATGAEGDYSQLTLSTPTKAFAVSLKGITVGTVIAKQCAPTADNLQFAVLTEVKAGKGVVVTAGGKTPMGILGGPNALNPGTIGIAPGLAPSTALTSQLVPTAMRLGKAVGKGAISDMRIYSESLPEKAPGKPAAQLSAKVMARVFALRPGTGTNSTYKSKVAGEPTYSLTKP